MRARSVFEIGKNSSAPQGKDMEEWSSRQHGDDLRAPSRSGGPSRSRTLSRVISSLGTGLPVRFARSSSAPPVFSLFLHLPDNHGTVSVEAAMRRAIQTLRKELAKSITWD